MSNQEMDRKKGKEPGRNEREGITLFELFKKFPDDNTAEEWFVKSRWPNDIHCPKCGSLNVKEKITRRKIRHWRCRDCIKDFTAKSETVLHSSKLGYQKLAFAVYLIATNLKGVASLKLHRDLGITQKSAWHLAHRIGEALTDGTLPFLGPTEIGEVYIGGPEKNKHKSKRKNIGRGTVGKTAVVAAVDRNTNQIKVDIVKETKKPDLHKFVHETASEGSEVYTDEYASYKGLNNYFHHETVNHGSGEYVRYTKDGEIHTNSVERFFSMIRRGYHGTYHYWSEKHTIRYANEFAARHNVRDMDTKDQVTSVVRGMEGKRLRYEDLIGKAA